MFESFYIYIMCDLLMALVTFLMGLYFYKSKGKAANLLSGYNRRSGEERKNFDEDSMCCCYGKRMMVMAIPFVAGAVIDVFWEGIGCALAWGVWIILFILLLVKRTKIEKLK